MILGQGPDLGGTGLQEVGGVFVGGLEGGLAVVDLFVGRGAGDAVVFDAGEAAFVQWRAGEA